MKRLNFFFLLILGCAQQNPEYKMINDYLDKNDIIKVNKDLIFIYNIEGCYSTLMNLYKLQQDLNAENDMAVIIVGVDIHQIIERFDNEIILFQDQKQLILRYFPDFNNGIILEVKNQNLIKINNEKEVSDYYNSI